MPNKDQTGPNGKGKKTGRGLGNCETNESELLKRRRERHREPKNSSQQ